MPALVVVVALWIAAAPAACGGSNGPPSTLGREELVEACARLAACRPPAATLFGATACAAITDAARAGLPTSWRDAARCAQAAGGDCAAVLACWNGGMPSSGCAPGAASSCPSMTASLTCLGGVEVVTDCAAEKLLCVPPDAMTTAACGEGPCDPATFQAHCLGDQLVTCTGGVATPGACDPGAACQGAAGAAACKGVGAPCTAGAAHCDGTAIVRCVGNAEARQDCAAGGYAQTCAQPSGMDPVCAGTFLECDPTTFADRCNGARLEYCQDGRVRGVDCTALGFAGCAIGDPAAGVPSRCRAAMPIDLPDAGPPDAAPSDGAP